MKTIAATILAILFLISSPVMADWADDFMATADRSGVKSAVKKALKAGVSPGDIINVSKEAGGISPADAIEALYRTGMSGSEVHAAAARAGVSSAEVATVYRQSTLKGNSSRRGGGPPEMIPGVGPPAILPPGGGQRPCSVPPVSPPGFNVRPGGLPPRC